MRRYRDAKMGHLAAGDGIRGTLAILMDCGLPKLAFTGPEYAKLGE
jgi:hypothetical protein